MTAWPLIHRELRVEARRQWNYWLRLLAGVIVTGAFVVVMAASDFGVGGGATGGKELFDAASLLLYFGIWLVAPLLTADCLSREKRDGTLPLLFLTPLTPCGVVMGKCAVHLLRAGSFILAAMPVIAIALLLGGVSGSQILIAGAGQSSALLLALAAGVLASAWTRQWIRAVLLAAIIGTIAFWFHRWLMRMIWIPTLLPGLVSPPFGRTAAYLGAIPMLMGVLAVWVAVRRVRSTNGDESLSRRQLWWLKTFCRPLPALQEAFRARSNWRLDRNPIGWLQQYSWSARLTKWGWCAAMITAETFAVMKWSAFEEQQVLFVFCFTLGLSFAAASSFRRERQSGALELILVTPLRVRQIILGRLKGIWGQFLPAMLVLVTAAWFGQSFSVFRNESTGVGIILVVLVGAYLSIPVVGLYYSLKKGTFLLAWMLTLLASWSGVALAAIAVAILSAAVSLWLPRGALANGITSSAIGSLAVAAQGLFALSFFGLLHRDLSQRNFPLEKPIA